MATQAKQFLFLFPTYDQFIFFFQPTKLSQQLVAILAKIFKIILCVFRGKDQLWSWLKDCCLMCTNLVFVIYAREKFIFCKCSEAIEIFLANPFLFLEKRRDHLMIVRTILICNSFMGFQQTSSFLCPFSLCDKWIRYLSLELCDVIFDNMILFSVADCRICVWNASDGSLVHSLTGHTESVSSTF